MDDARVSIVRRFDNPAVGLLVGFFVLAVQAAWFVRAAEIGSGSAPVAIAGSIAVGFVLTLLLWSRGARWSAVWVAALSSVWAYVAVLLAVTGLVVAPQF